MKLCIPDLNQGAVFSNMMFVN